MVQHSPIFTPPSNLLSGNIPLIILRYILISDPMPTYYAAEPTRLYDPPLKHK